MYLAGFDTHESRCDGVRGGGEPERDELPLLLVKKDVIDLIESLLLLAGEGCDVDGAPPEAPPIPPCDCAYGRTWVLSPGSSTLITGLSIVAFASAACPGSRGLEGRSSPVRETAGLIPSSRSEVVRPRIVLRMAEVMVFSREDPFVLTSGSSAKSEGLQLDLKATSRLSKMVDNLERIGCLRIADCKSNGLFTNS